MDFIPARLRRRVLRRVILASLLVVAAFGTVQAQEPGIRPAVEAGSQAGQFVLLPTPDDPAGQVPIAGIVPVRGDRTSGPPVITNAAGDLTYHGGPVQHTQKIFTIFWAGNTGYTFPAGYQTTNNQFIQDLSASSYYAIATQYNDGTGFISPTLVYGGTWLDTNAITFATNATPTYAQMLAEVNAAKAANGWTSDSNSYFQFFTPSGYVGTSQYCGFHDFSALPIGIILYPWSNATGSCFGGGPYPNASVTDAAISVSAHEIMETVTDPAGNAWWDPISGGEIGDLCAWQFGSRAVDGSNLTISGHNYLAQLEWSNASHSCVISYSTGPPGAFGKSAPTNAATGQSTSPTLSWGASAGATGYEYCIDTTNDNACSTWTSTGTNTSVGLSSLANNTPYYWHARATNGSGTTYANASTTAFWSFTTVVAAPGAFGKSAPTNAATGQSTSPTLSWGAASGATGYEYCIDTTNDNACSAWTSTGTNTSVGLSGLANNTTYYWHARATNAGGATYANASTTAFWSFTTIVAAPGAFGKSAPANAATGQSTSPTLSWGAATGATGYEYCIDTTNDNACTTWISTGTNTSVGLSSLANNTVYYWHARASNAGGTTYANASTTAFWSFTTVVAAPGAFGKSAPTNAATGQSTSPTLSWGAATGATGYEYCIDTTNDNACTTWTSTGTNTSVGLSALVNNTAYYWHVRATNPGGTTYADGGSTVFWSFTTIVAAPGAFSKSAPANAATGQSTGPTLSWGASTSATGYEYCIDTTNDNACTTWTSTGTNTSVGLSALSNNTAYYWHVRATNPGGTTYADGGGTVFWSFTTVVAAPAAFGKSTPANAATGQSTSPTLSWGAATGATGYEYCYDTTNDNACTTWTSTGTNTNVGLSSLANNTAYYWHVRATNPGGTTYADGGSTVFWSFTTIVAAPGAFGKSAPTNAATGQSTSPTLSWGAATGATGYEYCIDTTNDNACTTWTSTGTNASIGLSALSNNTAYYWHVRATNAGGTTYADGATTAFWSFTTVVAAPAAFGKSVPTNAATGQSTSPTLSWGAATGATGYEYCIDTTNDNACTTWTSTGTNTSVGLSGVANNTVYYWHVRATNAGGTTYANASTTAFWSFTTVVAAPSAFGKSAPTNAATGQSTSPTLSWGAASGATGYEYCIDTTNDNACSAWTSTGTNTSVGLSALSNNTAYYWHVRAINPGGTTYADGGSTVFWSFTTIVAAPGVFSKSAPTNAATGQSSSPTLSWGASTGATGYEYCIDTTNDNACTTWTSTGTNTSVGLSALANNTVYYWHVRATNPGGTTYADGGSTVFWSFTTIVAAPGAFGKTAPTNSATGQSTSPTLNWGASTGATGYEYCIDTTNDNACTTWTSTGTNTSVGLSALAINTVYYWHVRATNPGGTTYADGGSTVFWSFTTIVAAPGAFGKSAPTNAATGQSTSPTLSWGASTGATGYEYCIDTTNDNACTTWTSTGTNTSVGLSALSNNTPYYWHVRATNAGGTTYADGGSTVFWSFTTIVAAPSAFGKTAPTNAATGQSTSPTLSWGAATGATGYEYCYDTTNDNACTTWTSTGTNTSVGLSALSNNTVYYWHVRAANAGGTTYADGGGSTVFWSFTTIVAAPSAFGKSAPTNAATGQSTSPTLSWGASTGATGYEYCYDTTNDNACSTWTSTGTNTSVGLSALSNNTPYYWHVRATNAGGTTYANASTTAFWSFTTVVAAPGAFGKSAPTDAATGQSTSPTLSWGASTGATGYEYCIDTTNDNACTTWISTGTNTSVGLSGLANITVYYWHVRATNAGGTTYADASTTAFWSFTTVVAAPTAFGKTAPTNAATGQSTSPTLSWGASTGATGYEYCIDTTNDNACTTWTSTGTNTSVGLSALSNNTAYYWHVRATNAGGTTYANASTTAFWSFTTVVAAPSAFGKTLPTNAATGQSTSPTLSWGASTGATGYEYCIDTTNDNACTTWTSTGTNTSVGLSSLANNTPYYWHVRATNPGGTTYADGGSTVFWSFTTIVAAPGAFGKSAPTNAATGQLTSPTLSWGAASGATGYEYCYDTTNDNACTTWTSTGTNTSVGLSALANNTAYYWHVRATNPGGTTYADGGSTVFWSFTTSLVQNGDFSNGTTAWSTFASPDSSYMESTTVNGVYQWRRVPQIPGQPVSQATIYQETGVALGAGVPVTATFDIGNTSSARKYMKVLLVGDAGFTDLAACTFWLPPNAPLKTYQVRGHTTTPWSNTAIYFYASSPNTDGGYYLLDNVSMTSGGVQPVDRTECVDPNVPAPPSGAASATLLTNGDFGTGALAPWTAVGAVTTQTTSNVLEFYRGAAFPPPVIVQATGQAMTANQLITATFKLGNSSPVEKRVLILLNDSDFSDLTACTFWLQPGAALATYTMTGYASKAWTNATFSIYPSTQYDSGTPANNPWIQIDDITFQRTPNASTTGTTCLEPGGASLPVAARVSAAAWVAPVGASVMAPQAAPSGGVAPAGATQGPTQGPGNTDAPSSGPDWSAPGWIADGGFEREPHSVAGRAGAWVAAATATGTSTLLRAEPIDLTNASRAAFTLESWLTTRVSRATVQVRPVASSVWQTVEVVEASSGWQRLDVDLSAFVGDRLDVQLVFEGAAPADVEQPDTWRVDELSLTDEQ